MEEQTRDTAYENREKAVLKKNILAQYVDLVKERDEVQQRIYDVERRIERIEAEGEVTDTVRGGEGGTRHYKIHGFPSRDYSKAKTLLMTRKASLHSLEAEIEQMIVDVQLFINGIENSHDRRIVTMRVVDGLPFKQIARKMGGGNTEDGVRQAYNRIINRKN